METFTMKIFYIHDSDAKRIYYLVCSFSKNVSTELLARARYSFEVQMITDSTLHERFVLLVLLDPASKTTNKTNANLRYHAVTVEEI